MTTTEIAEQEAPIAVNNKRYCFICGEEITWGMSQLRCPECALEGCVSLLNESDQTSNWYLLNKVNEASHDIKYNMTDFEIRFLLLLIAENMKEATDPKHLFFLKSIRKSCRENLELRKKLRNGYRFIKPELAKYYE